jgi:sugar lactone lactonase YvrE
MEITPVGSFRTGWGESLIWDETRARLWFVDCATSTLHWLDDGDDTPGAWVLPSMATAVVPTSDGRLIAILDDGLSILDPDSGAVEPLTPYPDALGGRANDACADLAGNLITGRLKLGPADGSTWRFGVASGWTLLDDDIANTNGPAVAVLDGVETLIIGDTSADYFAAPYDSVTGVKGERRVFGDAQPLEGRPDGATVDADGGLWCALVGGGQLARFTTAGLDRTVALPVTNPTDVTFGGLDLDRLYVVSIGGDGLDGSLLRIDDIGVVGRLEPRVDLG